MIRGIHIKAVILGSLLDIAASSFLLLLVISLVAPGTERLSVKDLQASIAAILLSGEASFLLTIAGSTFLFLGAYTASRLAGTREVEHAIWTAVLSEFIGTFVGGGAFSFPRWLYYLSWLLIVCATVSAALLSRPVNGMHDGKA